MADFNNPEISKNYKIQGEDCMIQAPGYRGKLSDISDAAILDAMIARSSQLVAKADNAKPAPAPAFAKANPPA